MSMKLTAGVNFIKFLCTAFMLADPKSKKRHLFKLPVFLHFQDLRQQKLPIECWWNWLHASISSSFYEHLFCLCPKIQTQSVPTKKSAHYSFVWKINSYNVDEINYSACGLARLYSFVTGKTYGVVSKNCTLGYYSFAHELAHMYGCQHNRETNQDNFFSPTAYGFLMRPPVNSGYRTIMA